MVGHDPLEVAIGVRIPARQPVKRGKPLRGSAFRAHLRGKRVKSAFFETCGQPPEKEGRKNAKILNNFLLTQMAALVVLNSDCSKLSKAAIKKAIRTS